MRFASHAVHPATAESEPRHTAASAARVAAIILVGTLLLLPRLGAQSLWLDEGLTVEPAIEATSVADLVHRVQTVDTQPPLSHFVLYVLRDLGPRDERLYRLPSFLAVEIGIVLLYVFVRRLWGSQVALLTAACSQLSPFLCLYAAEARNYGLWFLLIAASLVVAERWLDAVRTRRGGGLLGWTIALAVANALGLWTHLFHLFVIAAECVVLATVALAAAPGNGRWHAVRLLAAGMLLTVVLFAPWLVLVLRAAQAGTTGVSWTRPFASESLAYYLYAAHFGTSLGPNLRFLHLHRPAELVAGYPVSLAVAGTAIAVTLLTYAVLVADALRSRARRWELLPLLVWPLCALAGPIAYGWLREFPLHPRHLMLVWPLLPMIVSLGLVRHPRLRPWLAAALLVQLVALGNLLFVPRYAKDDERGAVRFAEQHSRGRTYVLGDVATLYVTRVDGRPKGFDAFAADTHDVWFIDNRSWEATSHQARANVALKMRTMGMRYEGGTTRFRGIVLRHWTAPGP